MFIEEGGELRVRNASIKINKVIYLVGSRATGTSTIQSDFDYIIPGIRSREWQKIKNSLPGAKSFSDGLPNRVDLLRVDIDFTLPYIKFE